MGSNPVRGTNFGLVMTALKLSRFNNLANLRLRVLQLHH